MNIPPLRFTLLALVAALLGALTPYAAPPVAHANVTEPKRINAVSFPDRSHGWIIVGDALLATRDGGAHWEKQRSGDLRAVEMLNARRGWLLDGAALLRTDDGGRSWHAQLSAVDNLFVVPHAPGLGWATRADGLWSTIDGGQHWRRVSAAKLYGYAFGDARVGLAWHATLNRAHEFAGGAKLLRTANGGKTWQAMRNPCEARQAFPMLAFATAQSAALLCSDASPELHRDLKQLFRSNDGGRRWRLVGDTAQWSGAPPRFDNLPESFFSELSLLDARHVWMTANSREWGGMISTADGGHTWRDVRLMDDDWGMFYSNPVRLGLRAGLVVQHNVNTDDWVLLYTRNEGALWQQIYPPLTPQRHLTMLNATTAFGVGTLISATAVLKTTDGRRTWHQVGTVTIPCIYEPWQPIHTFRLTGPRELWAVVLCTQGALQGWMLLHSADGGVRWATITISPYYNEVLDRIHPTPQRHK